MNKNKDLHLRLSDVEYNRFQAYALKNEMTVSEYVRYLVRRDMLEDENRKTTLNNFIQYESVLGKDFIDSIR